MTPVTELIVWPVSLDRTSALMMLSAAAHLSAVTVPSQGLPSVTQRAIVTFMAPGSPASVSNEIIQE